MASLNVSSSNPNFSYLILKNPSSGMQIKKLHKGHLFGWFSNNDSSYNIYFKDGADEISYKEFEEQEFEYINGSRYNSIRFVLDAMKEYFKTAFKVKSEQDIENEYEHSVTLNMVFVRQPFIIESFKKHFSGYNIQVEQHNGKNYKFIFSTNKSLYELLNLTLLFSIMVCILNHENLYITDDIVEKYLKMLSVIDAPYFIRYLFKSKIIQSFNQFQKFVSYLNDSKTNKIDMSFGDSHIMRINYIKEQIDFKNNIIDIGCGEGRYIGALARQLNKNDKKYLACDIDEEILVKTKKKFDLKQMDNIEYYNSVHEVIFGLQDGEKYDCIITEVIEHMEMNEAKDLLQIILNEDKIKKIIVTTPNKDFNQFYFDDDDKNFRHEDHKFELTRNEFFNFIDLIIDKEKIDVEFYGIGDEVDGNQITSCAIIKRK